MSTPLRRRLLRASGALALLAVAGAVAWHLRSDPDDVPPPPERLLAATSIHALLVGCTEYPALKAMKDAQTYEASVRLEGPANDVALMHKTLRDYLGVPESHIHVLAGWPDDPAGRPTKANILGHLARLAREVPRGGRVVFHFAGHGSQAPDQNQGDEQDSLDELLLPADVKAWDLRIGAVPGAITDDELRAALAPMGAAGLSVWVIVDSCHASSMVRGSDVRMRDLPPDELGIPSHTGPSAAAPGPMLRDTAAPQSGVVAFYAVQSHQLAPEMTLPRSKTARNRASHGLFTFLLARTLMRFGGALSFRELYAHVKSAYEALPWPSATPAAEGDLDLVVSGTEGEHAQRLVLERGSDGWWLDGGSLRGLTVGSVVEAFHPGGLGDPARRVGTLALTTVRALRSAVRPVPGDFPTAGNLPARLSARLAHVAAGDTVVRLAVVDASGAALEPAAHPAALRLALAEAVTRARFPLVAPPQADCWLRVVPDDGTTASGAVRMALEPRRMGGMARECDADGLEEALCRLFRSVSLRRTLEQGLAKTLPEGVAVRLDVAGPTDAELKPLEPGATLRPGDRFELNVSKQGSKDVSVSAWYFDANHDIQEVARPQNLTVNDTGDRWLAGGTLDDDTFGAVRFEVLVTERAAGTPPPSLSDMGCASGVNRPVEAATRGAESETQAEPAVSSLAWTCDWGDLGIPSDYNEGRTVVSPPAKVRRVAGEGAATLPGEGLEWTSARVVPGNEGRADLLLLWGEGGLGACVDVDGDADFTRRPADELARAAAEDRLPVEVIVLLLASGERSARYRAPVRVDGSLLVLLDRNGDHAADRRWVLRADKWYEGPAWSPWLSSSHLGAQVGGERIGLDDAKCRKVAAAIRVGLAPPAR